MNTIKVNDKAIEVNLDDLEQDRVIIEAAIDAVDKLADKYQAYKCGPLFVDIYGQEFYDELRNIEVQFLKVDELKDHMDDLETLSGRIYDFKHGLSQFHDLIYRILEFARIEVDEAI